MDGRFGGIFRVPGDYKNKNIDSKALRGNKVSNFEKVKEKLCIYRLNTCWKVCKSWSVKAEIEVRFELLWISLKQIGEKMRNKLLNQMDRNHD